MLKYSGSHLVRTGFIGVVLVILIITVGLQPQTLWNWATSIRHQALFTEAGGLAPANVVKMSGVTVGSVSTVELHEGKALVTFMVNGKVRLGEDTTAYVRTNTLLGERMLTLESNGQGTLRSSDVIPVTRTGSPYSLTDALGELAANTKDTDTAAVNQSLDTLSSIIDRAAPQLGPTFDGLSRISKALNERNGSLKDLLKSAAGVTGVLGQRSQQLNSLILNANDLLGVLEERRFAIVTLLANISGLSQQLTGLVADHEAVLAPTLEKLNSVAAMLQRNNDNIVKAMQGLAKFQLTQAEAVNNGFYYEAFVANLMPAQSYQAFLDYALGFRRGVNAGQPPDNAGPRAEFPFPYNGIPPQGGR